MQYYAKTVPSGRKTWTSQVCKSEQILCQESVSHLRCVRHGTHVGKQTSVSNDEAHMPTNRTHAI